MRSSMCNMLWKLFSVLFLQVSAYYMKIQETLTNTKW